MPRYRYHRSGKPLRDRPTAVCPSCGYGAPLYGSGAHPAAPRQRYLRHGRVLVRPDKQTGESRWPRGDRSRTRWFTPKVPYRVRPARTVIVTGFRSHWKCTDPFHAGRDAYWFPGQGPLRAEDGSPPRGRRGHHPDLRKAKARLSRALQGKARR